MKKQIVSQTREFQPSYDDELLLDDTPRVNSFNSVTSDGVARAIAGASGEVPVVTENDNGKVLTAVYDEGGPAVEWGEAGAAYSAGDGISISDQNAISVTEAVRNGAAAGATAVQPGSLATVATTGAYSDLSGTPTIPTVDQTYDASSTNAQSGTAVAGAIAGISQVPASTSSDEGKVLTVDAQGAAAWATPAADDSISVGYNYYSSEYPHYTAAETNPLGLAAKTVRCQYSAGVDPRELTVSGSKAYTWTLVDATENIWDGTYDSDNWSYLYFPTGDDGFKVLGLNTTGVTDMGNSLFANCFYLTEIPLFDTSSATSVENMFFNCESLTHIPALDLSNCTNLSNFCKNCTSLVDVPLMDTSKVTTFYGAFDGCSALTTVPHFDTSSAESLRNLFRNCTSLTSVPLFDTRNCTSLEAMFQFCSSLTSIPLLNTDKVQNMGGMCQECTKVVHGALDLYQQASKRENSIHHSYTFFRTGANTTTGAEELAHIPGSWGGNGV